MNNIVQIYSPRGEKLEGFAGLIDIAASVRARISVRSFMLGTAKIGALDGTGPFLLQ